MFALPPFSAAPTYLPQASASITQVATGPCGVNVANFVGKLTIICRGIPPQALQSLNAKLRRASLSTTAALREADRWHEAYTSLESMLDELAPESDRAKEARRLLQNGEIDGATAVLRQLLDEALANSGNPATC